MAVKDQSGEARTPEDIYHVIQTTAPRTGDGFLRPATQADCWAASSALEGLYKVVNVPIMRSMPVWTFMEMVAFAEAT